MWWFDQSFAKAEVCIGCFCEQLLQRLPRAVTKIIATFVSYAVSHYNQQITNNNYWWAKYSINDDTKRTLDTKTCRCPDVLPADLPLAQVVVEAAAPEAGDSQIADAELMEVARNVQ